jgi:putative sterol carrier protein
MKYAGELVGVLLLLAAPAAAGPAAEVGKVSSAKEYFDTLHNRFRPEEAKDLHAVFQFNLTGPGACTYHVIVDDGTMKVKKGHAAKADVTISASAEDYVKVVNGEMGGVRAVMKDKMDVSGDLGLAKRMKKIFPPLEEGE